MQAKHSPHLRSYMPLYLDSGTCLLLDVPLFPKFPDEYMGTVYTVHLGFF